MKTKLLILKGWVALLIVLLGITTASLAATPYPNTGAQTVCINSTKNYGVEDHALSIYTWSISDPTAGNITGNTNLISVEWVKAGNYTLQVIETSGDGCPAPAKTISVTVTPTVTIAAFSPATHTRCQGAGIVTNTTTATNNSSAIVYSLDATTAAHVGNSINAATGAVTYAADWSGTTTITATAAGCNGPATTTFVETITPTVTIAAFSPATHTRCQGAGIVTNTTTATNNSSAIVYSLDATTAAHVGNSINAATGAVTYAADWSGTTTITATAAGCNGPATTTFVQTITPTVAIAAFSPSTHTRCQGAGIVTNTTTATNNSSAIVYSLDATTAAHVGNSINAATGAVTYAADWSGTTTITATAAGCNGPATTTFVETTTPTVTIAAFSPSTHTRCQGAGIVTNTTTATNNSSAIVYSLDATTAAHVGNSINAATGAVTYAADWSGTTTITATAAGCNGPATTTFVETIYPMPVPTISGPSPICVETTTNVYTTETGMTGYTWVVSAGGEITSVTGTNSITVKWNTAGAQTVSVNYVDGNGCTAATATVKNVTVNPLPVTTEISWQ